MTVLWPFCDQGGGRVQLSPVSVSERALHSLTLLCGCVYLHVLVVHNVRERHLNFFSFILVMGCTFGMYTAQCLTCVLPCKIQFKSEYNEVLCTTLLTVLLKTTGLSQ